MKIFNLNADEWDRTEEREGWRFKDAWIGAHTDAELIGASMYEVEPGNKQGPFHTHHANEEWGIALRGEPTLRTHEGEQQLRQGDVVAFPRGKEGAHQIRNDTDAPVRVLMLSTLIAPEIVEYMDTGKIGARSVAGERIMFARPGPEGDYWEGGEEPEAAKPSFAGGARHPRAQARPDDDRRPGCAAAARGARLTPGSAALDCPRPVALPHRSPGRRPALARGGGGGDRGLPRPDGPRRRGERAAAAAAARPRVPLGHGRRRPGAG